MNGVFCHEIHLCNTNVEIHESGWIGSFFQHVHITDAPLKPGEIQWLCCGLAATLKPVFFSSIRSFGGLLTSSGRPPARPPLAHLHLHLPTYFQSDSRTFQKDFPTKEMWDQTHLWLEWILSSVASGSLPAVKAWAAHLLCLDCDTCSRYDTLDLLIPPASLLQDASLILYQTTCKFLQDGVQKSSATVWAQAEPDFLVEAKREGEIFRGSCQLLLFRLHEGCHQVIASTFQPGCGCYFGSRLGCNQPFQLWIAILGWGLVVREVVGFSSCGSGWWLVVRDGQVREVNGDGVSRPVRIGRKHAQVFQPCNLFDLSHICTWGFRQFWHQFHPAQRSHEANTKLEEEFAHQLSHHLQPLQHPHHRSV